MPIYPYHCLECNELWDEVIRYEEKPDACPECGEKKNLKRLLGVPQKPKVQSGAAQDRWGYNKTTTETLFAGNIPGGRQDKTYDENANNAMAKEKADKKARKGATIAVTRPKSKVPTKK
jgi:putative FmdB family regulatory protein